MTEWKECLLGDLITFQRGHDLPKSKMSGNGYPVVGSNGIIGFHNEYTTEYPSITVGRSGNVGKPYIVYGRSWSHNTSLYIKEFKGTDPVFIYYFLQTLDLGNYAGGSAVPTLNRNHIHLLNVRVPADISIQKIIANTLKVLDDKIDKNTAINKNLEQQAQVIFLKMFPDIFSASASSSFQNLIEFSNGRKRPETIGDIPVYGGNGVLAYTNQSNAENCVIIGRVGAYCGNTFLCPEKCWTSDNAIQAKSKNEASPLFIYYLLRNASLPSRHIGTGQPLMTQAILNAIPVNEPSTQEIKSFINICTPLHETIFANEKQNISLAILRDTLLPKLMSGELDVSDLDI